MWTTLESTLFAKTKAIFRARILNIDPLIYTIDCLSLLDETSKNSLVYERVMK